MHRQAFLLTALSVLVLSLCSLTSVGNGQEPKSRYAANYGGYYLFRSTHPDYPDNQKGGMRFAISPTGKITGDCLNTSLQMIASLDGSLNEDNDFVATVKFPTAVARLQGTMALTAKGNLKGTLKQYYGEVIVGVLEVTLEPK